MRAVLLVLSVAAKHNAGSQVQKHWCRAWGPAYANMPARMWSMPTIHSDVRLSEMQDINVRPSSNKCCQCGLKLVGNTDCLNICLWLLLPLIFLVFLMQMLFALIIDILSAMFWSASTIINTCWTRFDNLCWRIFIVCVSPLLIIAGIFGMPCILGKIPNYRFLNQTRTEWYRALFMFPKEFPRWCKCFRSWYIHGMYFEAMLSHAFDRKVNDNEQP